MTMTEPLIYLELDDPFIDAPVLVRVADITIIKPHDFAVTAGLNVVGSTIITSSGEVVRVTQTTTEIKQRIIDVYKRLVDPPLDLRTLADE